MLEGSDDIRVILDLCIMCVIETEQLRERLSTNRFNNTQTTLTPFVLMYNRTNDVLCVRG